MFVVLIADDSTFQRGTIRGSLNDAGYKTIEAVNGREALEIAKKGAPGAIILDLLMPEMDGLAVLEQFKALGVKIPVIIVTADIQESTKKRCADLGAVGFVNKPVKGESLSKLLDVLKCYSG